MLRRVGAHLQPQNTVGIIECAASHNDVAVVQTLASERQAAMHLAISAVLHDDVIVRTIVRVFIGKRSLASLQHYGIVVDAHIASAYQYVVTVVYVNGVATWRLYARSWCKDIASDVFNMVTAVKMICPESTVYQSYVLHLNVGAMRQIYKTRTQSLKIGAVGIKLAPDPKLLPEAQSVAVYRSRASDGEAI